ncbi:MAG: hypothetical protein AAFN50_02840 [Pseudomonadota bacterium]
MNLITNNIKWIMLVSGMLTASLLAAAVAPTWTLMMMFGESLDGALSNIIVRNWGALVGLVGLLLIYGAFDSSVRKPVLLVAAFSKITFIGLVFLYGGEYLSKVAVSVAFDTLVVLLFILYLVGEKTGHDST